MIYTKTPVIQLSNKTDSYQTSSKLYEGLGMVKFTSKNRGEGI